MTDIMFKVPSLDLDKGFHEYELGSPKNDHSAAPELTERGSGLREERPC